MAVRRGTVRQHGYALQRMRHYLAVTLAMFVCFTMFSGATLAAPEQREFLPQPSEVDLGGGSYQVTASVFAEGTDGQVGSTASSGHVIQYDDNLVALPGCTESSCPWVAAGTGVNGTYGPQTSCAESDGLCWVQIVSNSTGLCTVAPVHDRGPLFVKDNWWASQSSRRYDVPRGIPAAEYARDGANFGYGAGISDVGYDIQNVYTYAAGIDLAGGTWKAIGLPTSAGITTVTVTMLWQAGINHSQACNGSAGDSGNSDDHSSTGNASTTTALNLRANPSLSASKLAVMPGGSRVTISGGSQNGFYPLDYNGTSGWASGNYLNIDSGQDPGADDSGNNEPPPPTTDGPSATVTTGLYLRSGPGTENSPILVMPKGATVTLTGQTSGSWLSVSYNGSAGWAHGDYLVTGDSGDTDPPPSSSPTGNATVTTSLNLRSGAGTNYGVILVMPGGAAVSLTGSQSNGYLSVTYQGTDGWAYGDYLSTSGGSTPDPPSGNAGSATVTSGLYLRTGPGTSYSAILVMPAGASVTLTGDSENGYEGVVYNGQAGYAYGGYLSTGSSSQDSTSGSSTATVIDGSLNLRADSSTSSAVLLVMPDGATVTLRGGEQNGFTAVTYNGTEGWAYSIYLQ